MMPLRDRFNRGERRGMVHLLLSLFLATVFLSGCSAPAPSARFEVQIHADQKVTKVNVAPGTTVFTVLAENAVTLGPLDRVEPSLHTTLTEGNQIQVERVEELYEEEETDLPFEHQLLQSELLEKGKLRLVQGGENGRVKITWRIIRVDGVEESRNPFKEEILTEPVPEIMMVGVVKAEESLQIQGTLAFLSGGNAYVITEDMPTPRLAVGGGNLDGYVLELSPTGEWLLFSRKSTLPLGEEINTLWVARISEDAPPPLDLGIHNVVHFAGWLPGDPPSIAFSTVEPRQAAPGWQANNDLQVVTLSEDGTAGDTRTVRESNSGGIYGWWGTSYAISPAGDRFASSSPAELAVIDPASGSVQSLTEILPYQTGGSWAWTSPLVFSPDGETLYFVQHGTPGGEAADENSPLFSLAVFPDLERDPLILSEQSGMFTSPAVSPQADPQAYSIAFLQALNPAQSRSSRYQLAVMDQDGSNKHIIFPLPGMPGMDPQEVIWEPGTRPTRIACIYQGNIWLVASDGTDAHPITTDGMVTKISWE